MKIAEMPSACNQKKTLEKYRTTKYRGRRLTYNSKLIKYKGGLYRIENTKIMCGDKIFIQDTKNCILETEDLTNLKIIGNGEVIGVSEPFLIFKNTRGYFIYNNGMPVGIQFYYDGGRLMYGPIKDFQPDIVKNIIVYGGILLVQSYSVVLFINLSDNTDTQFVFPGNVLKIKKAVVGGVECVIVRYNKGDRSYDALFYCNSLIAQNLQASEDNGRYMFEVSLKDQDKAIDQERFLHAIEKTDPAHCSKGHQPLSFCTEKRPIIKDVLPSLASGIGSVHCKIENTYETFGVNYQNQNDGVVSLFNPKNHLSHSKMNDSEPEACERRLGLVTPAISHQNYSNLQNKTQLHDKSNPLQTTSVISISPLEEMVISCLSKEEVVVFLKAIFQAQTRYVEKYLDMAAQRFESTKFALLPENLVKHGEILSKFQLDTFSTFFYKFPSLKEREYFVFQLPFTKAELEFLDRKYRRIFFYDPEIRNSKNLAYFIIKKESKHRKEQVEQKIVIPDILTCEKYFFKVLELYFGDTRIRDILDIMLENSIHIQADINDVGNCRQSSFILRSHCSLGSFIMNIDGIYKSEYFKNPCKVNDSKVEIKGNDDINFLNGACLAHYYKATNMDVCYNLGVAFGEGLLKGISDEDMQKYLKMVSQGDSKVLNYALLLVSTRSINNNSRRNIKINDIFRSHLETTDISRKKAVLCSIAIYNYQSNDSNIIDLFLKECCRFGPVDLGKNSEFYDCEYRKLAALCCAFVVTKPISPILDDGFCSLIINGLSSIDSGFGKDQFYRTQDCRPEEIFYSRLFQHTCDFSESVNSVIHNFSFNDSGSIPEIYKNAADVFYISLKWLKDRENAMNKADGDTGIYDWLINMAEMVEEKLETCPPLKIMFNFLLISLSIVRNGTADLGILRILRRQVLKSKDLKFMKYFSFFDKSKKDRNFVRGCDYESMQTYKICIGMVCANFGLSRLKLDVKQLIISFFIANTVSLDFSYAEILKMFLGRSFLPDEDTKQKFKDCTLEVLAGEKSRKLKKSFKKRFRDLNVLDKKILVDVLSDYYENYHFKDSGRSLLDLKILAKLIAISK